MVAGVATTYFEAIELRDRLDIANANLDNATKVLDGLKLEQRAGLVTALDVAQQETEVATVNASIPPLRQQLRQSLDALAILVGSTPEVVAVTHGTLDDLAQPQVQLGFRPPNCWRAVLMWRRPRRSSSAPMPTFQAARARVLPQHLPHGPAVATRADSCRTY